jgi:hypothetical protein
MRCVLLVVFMASITAAAAAITILACPLPVGSSQCWPGGTLPCVPGFPTHMGKKPLLAEEPIPRCQPVVLTLALDGIFLFFRGGPLRRERLVVEGGGGEALSASCWPGGGAAAGGKGAPCTARGGGLQLCQLQVRGGTWHCAVLYCLLLGSRKKPKKTPK